MEISRGFMSLLTELGGWEMDCCYKHVAPNGAPAFQRWLFNRASEILGRRFKIAAWLQYPAEAFAVDFACRAAGRRCDREPADYFSRPSSNSIKSK